MSERYDAEGADRAKRPGPPGGDQQWARASDNGRNYQAGRDQHVSETRNYWGPGSGPAPQATASLPPDRPLTGRKERTDALLDALAPDGAGTTVVTGLPGVGKTVLALHAAHRAVERGRFPGGTLHVHLRGYDPVGAVGPEQALESLLRALGVRDGDLPPTVEEQAALYRSELNRRAGAHGAVLIVADDASSPGQLRHLVPAHPAHRLLVTSRDALTAPDFRARLVPLDELDAESAAALITTALAEVSPDDPRAEEDPGALERVADYCGRLPLALTIAAALLTDDPGLPIAALADDLANTRTRLKRLQHEDGDGRSLAVETAFDLSYQRLGPRNARLFRLLSLNPGPDLSTEAAAVLSDREERETRTGLATLARAGLLNEQPPRSGRWRAHDLIRLYAAELPEEEGEDEALRRLLEHYAATCEAADSHLRALPGQPVSELFADRAAALRWLDAERANLTAMVPRTVADHSRTTVHLVMNVSGHLLQRRHFHDALTVNEHALAATRELGDRHNEAGALNNLGIAFQEVRRSDDAIRAHTHALAVYRELGDRHGEAGALNNLGIAFQEVRRYDDAVRAHTRAIAIQSGSGDPHSEARTLNNLGIAFRYVQRYDDAVRAHTRAIAIYRAIGNRHREARALNNLGNALRYVQRYDDAIHAHTQALSIHRSLEDRHREARALNNLGLALRYVQRYDEAIHAHTQALAIYRALEDRHREAGALNNLGIALRYVQRYDEAIHAHDRAIALFGECDDRYSEDRARLALDATLHERGKARARRGWRRWFRGGRGGGPEA